MIGLQILKRTLCASPEQVQAFRDIPVANISDCMSRMVAAGPRLRPMHKKGQLLGQVMNVEREHGVCQTFLRKRLRLPQRADHDARADPHKREDDRQRQERDGQGQERDGQNHQCGGRQ